MAELDVGFWQRGQDLKVVLDFNQNAAKDADTVKGLLLHRFAQE